MNNILMLFIFVPILTAALLALNLILAPSNPDEAKISAYECGFEVLHGQTRNTFNIQFYLIAMLFLIFDLEILLIYPASVTLYKISYFGFAIVIIFFIILKFIFI